MAERSESGPGHEAQRKRGASSAEGAPAPGRDQSPGRLREAHVVTCFLRSGGDVLLLRRSDRVSSYAGRWGAVTGFAEGDPIAAARREILEETAIRNVQLVRQGESFAVVDEALGRRWIVHPFLFDAPRAEPQLNWESSTFEWLPPTEMLRRETVPRLWDSYAAVAPTVESVEEDREHGSAYISLRALEVLRDASATCTEWIELRSMAIRLIDSHPDMAVLRNRINRTMTEAGDAAGVEASAQRVIASAIGRDRRASAEAAQRLAGRAVLTLSRSGTVTAALLEAKARVVIAESQPGGEGIDVAEELAVQDLQVVRIPDAALAAWTDFEVILVGADAVLPDGSLVNKIGTHLAALVARERAVPFYAVASTDKISTEFPAASARRPERVEDGVAVWSPTFEVTPASLITGYVTEEGLVAPEDIGTLAAELGDLETWRS